VWGELPRHGLCINMAARLNEDLLAFINGK
jgi:hypothetical protein